MGWKRAGWLTGLFGLMALAPVHAEIVVERGYVVLFDGDESGAMIETVTATEQRWVTESLARFRMDSPGGEAIRQVRSRWVEQRAGGLLEFSQTSGHGDSAMTLEAVLDEDGWQVVTRGYFGRHEQRVEAEELLGPVAEQDLFHSELGAVGDVVRYWRFGAGGRPESVRVELIESDDDAVRVISETATGISGQTLHYIDEHGQRLRTVRSSPMVGEMIFERVEPDAAQALVDSIEVEEDEDGPGVLDTDTEFAAGSGIVIGSLDEMRVRQLALLGRVWGFLKYHHPRITAGELHWDFELFRILPEVLAAQGDENLQRILSGWIDGLGDIAPCEPCATLPEELRLPPDLDWLADEDRLGAGLSARLRRIHERRPADSGQFFVSLAPGVGFASFARELDYPDISLDDDGFRLLTLFRWWNVIEYWFPYRAKIDADWPAVLHEFVPRLLAAADEDTYRQELLAFGARIGDGHVGVTGAGDRLPPQGECFLPAAFRFVEGRAVVVTVDEETAGDLRFGDVVTRLDERTLEDLLDEWAPYHSASNESARRNAIARFMGRGECEPAHLEVWRDDEKLDLEVERLAERPPPRFHDHRSQTLRLLSDQVAYLTLSSFRINEVDAYLEAIAGTEALVIDIRNYPSEFAVFALGQHLVTEPTEFARFTSGVINAPGAFAWTPPISLQPDEPAYQGRVAILIDEASVSNSEYTAMAFRVAPDAVVVGSTTAGANGNVSQIPLPGGLGTRISGIGVYYPDKSPMQRVGILADVPAEPTIAGVRAGRDEVLEAALRELLGPEWSEQEIVEMATRR